jgi:hypothetical protein
MSQQMTIDVEIKSVLRKSSLQSSGVTAVYEPAKIGDFYLKKYVCASAKRGDVEGLRAVDNDVGLNAREQIMALMVAARFGQVPVLRYIHEDLGVGVVDSHDCISPLMLSCMHGHLKAVQYLVEHGCSMEDREIRKGFTCVYLAIHHRHEKVAAYLREQGCVYDEETAQLLRPKPGKKLKGKAKAKNKTAPSSAKQGAAKKTKLAAKQKKHTAAAVAKTAAAPATAAV